MQTFHASAWPCCNSRSLTWAVILTELSSDSSRPHIPSSWHDISYCSRTWLESQSVELCKNQESKSQKCHVTCLSRYWITSSNQIESYRIWITESSSFLMKNHPDHPTNTAYCPLPWSQSLHAWSFHHTFCSRSDLHGVHHVFVWIWTIPWSTISALTFWLP